MASTLDIDKLTLREGVKLLKEGDISSEELLDHFCERIEADKKHSKPINAVVHVRLEGALKEAKRINKKSLLSGMPILIKDNMHLKGEGVECCSRILEGYISPYTGGACRLLQENGGLIFGRTNMDEFAMGSSNETSYRGVVRNPIHRDYTPGGSSGGAAASVKAGFSLGSLGSDTGGSIRQPAACCGVVGLKPTYGLVSRYGLVAFASSLDQIGPITKTVEDSALLLQAISGHDPMDSTSAKVPIPDYTEGLENSLKGKVIGVPREFFSSKISENTLRAVHKVIDFYKTEGAVIKSLSIPTLETAISIYYVIATAEASSNLARYDGVHYAYRAKEVHNLNDVYVTSRMEGFGKEVKRRVLMGTYMLSAGYYEAYYNKAQQLRSMMTRDFKEHLRHCDALIGPTMLSEVFKIGEKISNPVDMYLSDVLTTASNLTGLPSISIPCGMDLNGLPISYQLIGREFDEKTLLNLGHLYQQNHSLAGEDL